MTFKQAPIIYLGTFFIKKRTFIKYEMQYNLLQKNMCNKKNSIQKTTITTINKRKYRKKNVVKL